MNITSRDRVFISGKTDSGKSYLSKHMLWPQYARGVFFDVKWEHTDIKHDVRIYDHGDVLNMFEKGYNKILYTPHSVDVFDDLCEVLYNLGNVVLFVDEARQICNVQKIPPNFDKIIRLGRIRNVGTVICTQRPKIVHMNCMSEAEHFILFRQQLDADRSRLKEVIGDAADSLNDMDDHYFTYYSFHSGSVLCTPIKFTG